MQSNKILLKDNAIKNKNKLPMDAMISPKNKN